LIKKYELLSYRKNVVQFFGHQIAGSVGY
jgi:hypothetical protein